MDDTQLSTSDCALIDTAISKYIVIEEGGLSGMSVAENRGLWGWGGALERLALGAWEEATKRGLVQNGAVSARSLIGVSPRFCASLAGYESAVWLVSDLDFSAGALAEVVAVDLRGHFNMSPGFSRYFLILEVYRTLINQSKRFTEALESLQRSTWAVKSWDLLCELNEEGELTSSFAAALGKQLAAVNERVKKTGSLMWGQTEDGALSSDARELWKAGLDMPLIGELL